MLRVQRIEPKGELYEAERELRNRVLLRPIGLPDYAWEKKDEDSLHFVALQNDAVVGCVLLWPNPEAPGAAQLLQMAVDQKQQGQGVGRVMVAELMRAAQELGLTTVWCHARSSVADFYSRLGFSPRGPVFQEVGLDHQVMFITLASQTTRFDS